MQILMAINSVVRGTRSDRSPLENQQVRSSSSHKSPIPNLVSFCCAALQEKFKM
jgi:hypothetical protein